MACKGVCNIYEEKGVAIRDWNYDPDLKRCSTCNVIIHKRNWILSKKNRTVCPCCGYQLKTNSRGKRARERRQEEYWNKAEAVQ